MGNYLLESFGFVLLCAGALKIMKLRKKRRERKYKTRPINRKRKEKNAFIYFLKMKACDPEQFFKLTRMTVPVFDKLHDLVHPLISRRHISDGICSQQRLAITLQYLSQGGTMLNLAWAYQMGSTTIHKIIHETCIAIWDVLSPTYLKSPSSEEEWIKISNGFFEQWNFPNCLGALDGKHIAIQCPPHSSSMFFNYKKFFSIVLMAACDSNYLFTMVDIGACGSRSDGGIFKNSAFGENFDNKTMHVPPPKVIPNTNIEVPYCLVADDAFPLKDYIMRPYPGVNLTQPKTIFNYRLSRARRTIENTFGILVARWRILKQTISAKVENIDNIVKACVVLHNYCKLNGIGKTPATNYCPPGFIDNDDEDNGSWRQEIGGMPLRSVGRLSSNNARRLNMEARERLQTYFLSPEGELPWQIERVTRGRRPQLLDQ